MRERAKRIARPVGQSFSSGCAGYLLIRPDFSNKRDYHAVLLSSHNFPGAAWWAKSFSDYKSSSDLDKTSYFSLGFGILSQGIFF
jgi:hypothetical protein